MFVWRDVFYFYVSTVRDVIFGIEILNVSEWVARERKRERERGKGGGRKRKMK